MTAAEYLRFYAGEVCVSSEGIEFDVADLGREEAARVMSAIRQRREVERAAGIAQDRPDFSRKIVIAREAVAQGLVARELGRDWTAHRISQLAHGCERDDLTQRQRLTIATILTALAAAWAR